jgi:hypothetical protein
MSRVNQTYPNHENSYFMGFERSLEFERLWFRLERLERWKELAIRPSPEECDTDDALFLDREIDDVRELQERCSHVRDLMNKHLPPIQQALDDVVLVPTTSNIPDAGLGLFYKPPSSRDAIPKGTTICFYTGHIHNFHSSLKLEDKSYLMMVQGTTLVDPRPLKHIKARYINDPLNENLVNCKYVPEELRSAVVATKDIMPGEEILVSYGDAYWRQHKTAGRRLNG